MPAETILITGASGFVATHVVDAFLQAGYAVRGTVRSQETADKVRSTFPQHVDRLSFAIVPDIGAPNAFDEASKGVQGVIHTATPFQIQVDDNERDLLRPAIEGTNNLLASVKKNAADVRRVVITSSFAAIIDITKGNRPGHVYTEADWNPLTYEEAAKKDTPGAAAYTAAKTLAERAAWDFIAREQPSFDVATICPPMVYGPNKNATTNLAKLNTSSADIYRFMNPASKSTDPVPTNSFWSWVDVRDVAQAHLKAYQLPEAGGQRFFIVQGNFSYQQVTDILREKVSEIKDRVPVGNPGSGLGDVDLYGVDNSKSKKTLGINYHNLEQTVVDSAHAFLKLEKSA